MKKNMRGNVFKKQKDMALLNSRINHILPELMSRNTKLVQRLKDKLVVSTFFNNIEQRNKKFFNGFIFSSDRRVKDLKTGLKIKRTVQESEEKMSSLNKQMQVDLILNNADIFLHEKRLIKENTEEETHIKINELINHLRTAVKTPSGYVLKPVQKKNQPLSWSKIKEASELISEKIKNEEYQINDKIKKYLKKIHETLDEDENNDKKNENYNSEKNFKKRKFIRYAETLYLKDDIKFMNYKKPKQKMIKDKEAANLMRLQKYLYNTRELNKKKLEINQQNKNKPRRIGGKMSLVKNNSMTNLSHNYLDEIGNIDVTGKDTIQILNKLKKKDKYLNEIMERKMEKVNSLIDFGLPYPSTYELVLKHNKRAKSRQENERKNHKYYTFCSLFKNKNYDINNKKGNRTIKISKSMKNKITLIKDEINNIQYKSIIFSPTFMTQQRSKI